MVYEEMLEITKTLAESLNKVSNKLTALHKEIKAANHKIVNLNLELEVSKSKSNSVNRVFDEYFDTLVDFDNYKEHAMHSR